MAIRDYELIAALGYDCVERADESRLARLWLVHQAKIQAQNDAERAASSEAERKIPKGR